MKLPEASNCGTPLGLRLSEGLGVIGAKFGRLTLKDKLPGSGKARWRCACDCGRTTEKRLDDLRSRMKHGLIPSCGCWFAEERSRISLGMFDATAYMQKRYGRLLVTGVEVNTERSKAKNRLVCLCDCGAQAIVRGDQLLSGLSKSCGCLKRERAAQIGFEVNFDHGKTIYGELTGVAPIYQCWSTIKKNCLRGWKVGAHRVCHEYDPRWDDFKEFYKDFGDIKVSQTISRRDDQLPWSKSNCFVNTGQRAPRKKAMTPNVGAKPKTTAAPMPE